MHRTKGGVIRNVTMQLGGQRLASLEIFVTTSRHHLYHHDTLTQIFTPELTDRQKQVLDLLGIPHTAYTEKP